MAKLAAVYSEVSGQKTNVFIKVVSTTLFMPLMTGIFYTHNWKCQILSHGCRLVLRQVKIYYIQAVTPGIVLISILAALNNENSANSSPSNRTMLSCWCTKDVICTLQISRILHNQSSGIAQWTSNVTVPLGLCQWNQFEMILGSFKLHLQAHLTCRWLASHLLQVSFASP